jgi:hypothetical protein
MNPFDKLRAGREIRSYGGFSSMKIIVDAFFGSKVRDDFQFF